jgi:hypothetical protein
MDNKRTLIGQDGVVEFGEHLNKLHEASHTDYSFEMPDVSGRLVTRSLDDVIGEFQDYVDSRREVFRVRITYIDRQMGTMGYTDKEFKRISK